MSKIKVEFYQSSEITSALEVINKFQKINDTNFRLKILLDHDEKANAGYYYEGGEIFVNPMNCEPNTFGNPEGNSIGNVIIHEFCHYLDRRYKIFNKYFSYCEEYGQLFLTKYAEDSLEEEIAELLTVYLLNPYILKKHDPERYKWFSKFFKTPTKCDKNVILNYWKGWNKKYKKVMWSDYGLKVYKDDVLEKKRVKKFNFRRPKGKKKNGK